MMIAHGTLASKELGVISSVCHDLKDAAKTAPAWREMFLKASKIASGSVVEYKPSRGCVIPCPCGYCDFVTWLGQHEEAPGTKFLDCFVNPDASVLERVGYGGASHCLLSLICYHCGNLACRANPITLNRVCQDCALKDDSSALILASKVPGNFYLDSIDLTAIPKAKVDNISHGSSRRGAAVHLLADVVAAAYAKYGGEELFLAERNRRMEQKRPTRTNPSRKSAEKSNPYKRVKVEEDSVFDPLSFRCRGMEALPIGVLDMCSALSNVVVRLQPIKCSCCDIEGSPETVESHEWYAHGLTIKPALQEGLIRLNKTQEHFSSRYVGRLDESDELRRLMETVTAQYSYVKDRDFPDEEYMARNLELWRCKFDFGNGCQLTIHFRDHSTDYVDGAVGIVNKYMLHVQARIDSINQLPIDLIWLFQDVFHECEDMREADGQDFADVIAAIGLQETSASQLLASLMKRVSTNPHALNPNVLAQGVACICTTNSSETLPVMHDTRDKLIEAVWRR